jgi:hypothetical protein
MAVEGKYIIEEISEYYYSLLTSKLIYKIRRIKDIRSAYNTSLNNLWEDICVQIQYDKWDSWQYTEHYIYGLCEDEINKLPKPIQEAMSTGFEEDRQLGEIMIDINSAMRLLEMIYDKAMSFNNERIRNYFDSY